MKKEASGGKSYPRDILEHYRFRAIELYNKRKKINDIADFFGVHRCAVSHWITAYKRHGRKALKSKKAKGAKYKISKEDRKEVRKWLKQEWPKINEHRRKWRAMLYFHDESGVSLTPVLGRTWAPKGK